MLTFAEEILLLLLDDENGAFVPVSESVVGCALAGAVLMDLAFANKIDTDPAQLVVIDTAPTGNPMLDRVLARIADRARTETGAGDAEAGAKDTKAWIETLLVDESPVIRQSALDCLVERGILERREEKFLWVFRSRRYPTIDGRAEREVKLRVTGVLLSDEIPAPRDVALICLVDACGILRLILAAREVERTAPRIAQLRKMDLIGREVAGAIADIEHSMAVAMARFPL